MGFSTPGEQDTHASEHEDGGGDEIDPGAMDGSSGTAGQMLRSDGSAAAWSSDPPDHSSQHASTGADTLTAADILALDEVTAADITDETANWSFGTARAPDANRPVLVEFHVDCVGSGGSQAEVELDLDRDGDGTIENTITAVAARASGLASNPDMRVENTTTVLVPPGGEVTVVNNTDPNNSNSINTVLEVVL